MKYNYFDPKFIDKIYESVFDKNDVLNFIKGFVKYLKIDDYLSDVVFKYLKKGNLAIYNRKTKVVSVSLEAIIDDAKALCEENVPDKILFINIMIILTLVHEITHINQVAHMKDNNPISMILKRDFTLIDILTPEEYEYYYGYFTCERDAIITSLEYVLYLLKNILKQEKMFNYFFEILSDNLTNGYEIKRKKEISPIQIINKRFSKKTFPSLTYLDIYDSLKYGLPLSKDKLDNFTENKKLIIIQKINLH